MDRIPRPCLALVTPPERRGAGHLGEVVESAVRGGVNLVQLRVRGQERDLNEILDLAVALRRATRGAALLFVNGYPQIAVESGADGVHLPESSESMERGLLPAGLMVGRSVHSPGAITRALRAGTDLLVAGAVFPTASHPGVAPAGVELIEQACRSTDVPVIGIGGIGPANAASVVCAGAVGVAVISAIWDSDEPESAARHLLDGISGGERWARLMKSSA